jgi:two-component system sensor histidine kinase BaeS
MRDDRWGPPWKHGGLPAGTRGEEWQRFGRRMMRGAVVFVLFAMVLLFVAAGALAALITNVSPVAVFVSAVLLVVIVGTIGRLVGTRIGRTWRPIRDLIAALGRLADGDYTARVAGEMSGPVRPVAESFNEMARRLEDADVQRRRLLGDLGHELRTPLTVIRGEVEALLDGVHEPDPEHLELLLDEVTVMERLIEDLSTLSLAEAGALALHREPTDIGALVSDVADAHRRSAASRGVVVAAGDTDVGELDVDPVRIREVVTNLVINALRAMPHGGRLELTTERAPAGVVVKVTDTGTGIPADELDHVFDRFHKSSISPGSGLGLTISRDLVRAHGGTIDIVSREGAGTTVTVVLPDRR